MDYDYSGYKWIKVKSYKMAPEKSWEERYKQLESHHIEETNFLVNEVRKLAADLRHPDYSAVRNREAQSMNLLATPSLVTAEDFLHLPDNGDYELVDGKLVERNMGALSSYLAGRLIRFLGAYCENPFLGWVLPADATYQPFSNRPNLVRKPDASFIRAGRLPDETLPQGHIRLAPDLVIEVVSPNDAYYEVAQKLAEYRMAGVRLIWVVIPPTRTGQIRRLDGSLTEVTEDGELTGEDVVPGFRCSVRDLFQPPTVAKSPAE